MNRDPQADEHDQSENSSDIDAQMDEVMARYDDYLDYLYDHYYENGQDDEDGVTIDHLPQDFQLQADTVCSICLEPPRNPMMTSCPSERPHVFCTQCINQWLQEQQICPECRRNVL